MLEKQAGHRVVREFLALDAQQLRQSGDGWVEKRSYLQSICFADTWTGQRLQHIADRLILMGDWRDSDRSQMIEETGAFVEIERG